MTKVSQSRLEEAAKIEAALRSLGARPSIDEIIGAEGLRQNVLLAHFVIDAQPNELAMLLDTLVDPFGRLRNYFAEEVIMLRWTAIDPRGAIRHAIQARQSLGNVFEAWASNDPDTALAYGLEHGYTWGVLSAIAQSDPEHYAAILEEHPELHDWGIARNVVQGLARTDDHAAARYALAHGFYSQGSLSRIARIDPAGALELILTESNPRSRSYELDEIFLSVAETSGIDSALDLVSTLPPGVLRVARYGKLIGEHARFDPVDAIAKARALDTSFARSLALASIAGTITQSDPDKAIALLQETPLHNLSENAHMVSRAELEIGNTDHEVNSSWPVSISDLLGYLVQSRPEETMELVRDSGDQNLARSTAARWVASSPEEASAWIANLSPGDYRDAAVGGLTYALTSSNEPDFDMALVWALSLDPSRQEPSLRTLFQRWERHDPKAASVARRSFLAEGVQP